MNIQAVNSTQTTQTQLSKGSEHVREVRKKVEDQSQSEQAEKKQVQPEELFKQIKSLTDDGLYSVRFENDERASGLVVKIVNRESDEVIRQVPAEELLELKATLEDLRGNLVDTQV
ncbi:MAG: flagellar protein FlaG [Campylobacterota bacterium]|nr:flagellar protein FlaG [Campylobacterota bacterium]